MNLIRICRKDSCDVFIKIEDPTIINYMTTYINGNIPDEYKIDLYVKITYNNAEYIVINDIFNHILVLQELDVEFTAISGVATI